MKTFAANDTIDSWASLAALAEKCSDGSWIFRGEATARNSLTPKVGRVSSAKGSARKLPYKLADERMALEQFKQQARPHLTHTPASDLEWLAIAQHHGMPTRLLDWTESVLVAAFFAVEKAGVSGDALIYGVQGLRTLSKAEQRSPFRLKSPGIFRPPHITPRIPAQRSIFTVHPNPTRPFAPRVLNRWTISARVCANIKRVLDACAINEGSLFPDIDGLSRYIAWRYKWGKY